MSEEIETFDDDVYQPVEKKRPVFLTVLCILSWVAGGFSVVISLVMLMTKDFMIEAIERSMDFVQTDHEVEVLEATIENFNLTASLNFGLYAISIIAVIMMFKLNKVGFYIYAVTHTVLLVYPMVLMPFGNDMAAMLGIAFSVAIYLAFIIMYGVNLKHMK